MNINLRNEILEEVQRTLLGPIGGEEEQLDKNPLDFYTVGVLFPSIQHNTESEDSSLDLNPDNKDAEGDEEDENATIQEIELYSSVQKGHSTKESSSGDEDSLELTTKFRPSAAGISVLVQKGSNIKLTVSFGSYHGVIVDRPASAGQAGARKVKIHTRTPFYANFEYSRDHIANPGEFIYDRQGKIETLTLTPSCDLSIVTRKYKGAEHLEIKTFTLINSTRVLNFKNQKNPEECIFQPSIKIFSSSGLSAFEDLSEFGLMTEEDINLKLLYRNYHTYALGHGISVDWSSTNQIIDTVESNVLPVEKVNGVDMNPEAYYQKEVLFIKKLGGKSIDSSYDWLLVEDELIDFCKSYEEWIGLQEREIQMENPAPRSELIAHAGKNLSKCRELYRRMLEGVSILGSDKDALKAFEDANKAMFMQRVMGDFSRHRRIQKRVQCDDAWLDDSLPDYSEIPYDAASGVIWKDGKLNLDALSKKGNLARWRPFQLAFLLSQVKGVIDPSSADRDTVDLIWFPTGGGKTEAYLGLTAFTIFFRRLSARKLSGKPDEGAGVSVLMRYTLRLLNKQQFERAGILICSCELIRRSEPSNYGNVRISNGIWMGSSMTPNNINEQQSDYKTYIKCTNQGNKVNSAIRTPPILSCPCCGNRLVKESTTGKVSGRWGYFQRKNLKGKAYGEYLVGCTNTKCDFHVTQESYHHNSQSTLPIFEVDQVIYRERPSLLFSTVDKFVQLAWNSECFSLFNLAFDHDSVIRTHSAPSLIIQDELHLISSALGTIYGVYEIVIDKLCREQRGKMPKIIGASATVRNAAEQCNRLYARAHFMQFPPPGVDADDSFFSRKIKGEDENSRMYVGFMASGTTTSTALIRLTSVLLERIPALPVDNRKLDNYYTLVVYFNALKELGKFRTFLTDDIVAYRKFLANHFGTFVKRFNHDELCELSSVMTADEITTGLDRLEKTTLPSVDREHAHFMAPLLSGGIRTLQDVNTAMPSLFSALINEESFKFFGLEFSGDRKVDIDAFMSLMRIVFPKEGQPVHIAPATNMISVGVDVPRLNTMIVCGQPKTAAEYIQASSRVGREGPGIVFSFLSPTKNRDRSHYERFKSFHQAYYYHVESSSVTPFSGPALEKVLPTVLIALTRSLFLKGKTEVFDAKGSEYRDFIYQLLGEIQQRAQKIYPQRRDSDIAEIIEKVGAEYFKKIEQMYGARTLANHLHYLKLDPISGRMKPTFDKHQMVYNAPSQFVDSVLDEHVATLQTLRNVESSSLIIIKN